MSGTVHAVRGDNSVNGTGGVYVRCSGDLLPQTLPAEKANASEDQAGQASTGDGGGDTIDGDCRIVVSLEAAKIRAGTAQDKLSDGLPRVGMDVEIVCRRK